MNNKKKLVKLLLDAYAEGYREGQIDAKEWILCSEKLPESSEKVLTTHNGEIRISKYYIKDNTWLIGDICAVSNTKPIAWMPLPKPYKENINDIKTEY